MTTFDRTPDDWQDRFNALREEVRRTTPEIAVPFGRQYAIDLLHSKHRVRLDKANAIYDALLELAPPASRPTINISLNNLKRFITENIYQTLWDRPLAESGSWAWAAVRLEQAQRIKAEQALGTFGLDPIYGALSSAEYGARDYGDAFIELKPEVIQERALLLAGDSWRLVNSSNPVYVGIEGARAIQYHPDWLPDARAAAAMLWPTTACLRQGDPGAIAACILEGAGSFRRAGKGERSYTEFHLVGGLTLDDVRAFHVTTACKAEDIVRLLLRLNVEIPVYVVGFAEPFTPEIEGFPFKVGDRVVLITGAVGRVAGVRRLEPVHAEFWKDGRQAFVELRGLKGPSPNISGWSLYEDTANIADTHIVRVLRPREAYKLPPSTLLMMRNRKLMRERGEQRGLEFDVRYKRGLIPFESALSFDAWFKDLLDSVPGELGKWALGRIADTPFVEYDPELAKTGYYGVGQAMQQWVANVRGLGVIFGWYEMANELGVESEPPMAGAPLDEVV